METEQYWGEAMFELAARLGGRMSEAARARTVGSTHAAVDDDPARGPRAGPHRGRSCSPTPAGWRTGRRSCWPPAISWCPGARRAASPPSGRPGCGPPWSPPRPGGWPTSSWRRSGPTWAATRSTSPSAATRCRPASPTRRPTGRRWPRSASSRRRAWSIEDSRVGRGRRPGRRRRRPRGADRAGSSRRPRVSRSGAGLVGVDVAELADVLAARRPGGRHRPERRRCWLSGSGRAPGHYGPEPLAAVAGSPTSGSCCSACAAPVPARADPAQASEDLERGAGAAGDPGRRASIADPRRGQPPHPRRAAVDRRAR